VARIRIDERADERLTEAADEIDATKSGLASEIIVNGAEEIIESRKEE
jgi:hypothetical protein